MHSKLSGWFSKGFARENKISNNIKKTFTTLESGNTAYDNVYGNEFSKPSLLFYVYCMPGARSEALEALRANLYL
jgi:hypothetical protein